MRLTAAALLLALAASLPSARTTPTLSKNHHARTLRKPKSNPNNVVQGPQGITAECESVRTSVRRELVWAARGPDQEKVAAAFDSSATRFAASAAELWREIGNITQIGNITRVQRRSRTKGMQPQSETWEQLLARMSGGVVALSPIYPDAHMPTVYGHVWPWVENFWSELVRPRVRSNESLLEIVLPAGTHLGARGSHSFEEFEALWSSPSITRLKITRATWVPFCWKRCCWSHGTPPVELKHRLAWSPLRLKAHYTFGGASRKALGRDARLSLGADHGVGVKGEPLGLNRTLLWVLSDTGTNGRRIRHEARAIELAREAFEPRGWRVTTLDTATKGAATYKLEARAIASADALVSLVCYASGP